MELYLLRHAHAGERHVWKGPDERRPLTARGRASAGMVAEGLAHEPPMSQIVSSPLSRALETAEIVGKRLGLSVTTDGSLAPGCDMARLGDVILSARSAERLLLVGHGPDLGDIITDITHPAYPITLKKAAVALIRLPAITPESSTPGRHALAGMFAGASLVWLRAWREWEAPHATERRRQAGGATAL